jgi:predicted DNA-binding transcriptional regulator AlpA
MTEIVEENVTTTISPTLCSNCGARVGGSADPIMLSPDVSRYINRPESTLRHWRNHGEGPRWFRLGRRVAYRRSDVDAWLAEQFNTTNRRNHDD